MPVSAETAFGRGIARKRAGVRSWPVSQAVTGIVAPILGTKNRPG